MWSILISGLRFFSCFKCSKKLQFLDCPYGIYRKCPHKCERWSVIKYRDMVDEGTKY